MLDFEVGQLLEIISGEPNGNGLVIYRGAYHGSDETMVILKPNPYVPREERIFVNRKNILSIHEISSLSAPLGSGAVFKTAVGMDLSGGN